MNAFNLGQSEAEAGYRRNGGCSAVRAARMFEFDSEAERLDFIEGYNQRLDEIEAEDRQDEEYN